MTDIQVIKAGVSTLASAGIWAPVIALFPEYAPLVVFSGFFGGIARWIALREKLWPDGLGTVVTGATVALFLWPVAEPIMEPALGTLEMEPTTAVMFGGFVTGLMGVSIIGWILDVIRAKRKEVKDAEDDDG